MADIYESVLCVIKECLVYRIPPRSTARGYRASDWDTTQLLWSGRLRVIATGDHCALHLEDPVTGELFVKCPYNLDGSSVEPVIDSSRYFVIRVVDPASGSHAFLGLGLAERSWAFDLNVALQDHVKRVKAANQPSNPSPETNKPQADYSLREGQTIQINLGHVLKKKPRAEGSSGDLAKFSGLLPPPPRPGIPVSVFPTNDGFGSATQGDATEFGDFSKAFMPAAQNDSTSSTHFPTSTSDVTSATQSNTVPADWTTF